MKAPFVVLLALAAVGLASVAAALPDTAKQRVAIDTKILPQGKFVLTPLQSGALNPDSGTASGKRFESGPSGSTSGVTRTTTAPPTASPSAPGSSSVAPDSTPASPAAVAAAMRGSVRRGSRARRGFSAGGRARRTRMSERWPGIDSTTEASSVPSR
jgi:hypothetical protein